MRVAVTVLVIATLGLGACASQRGADDIYGVPENARVDPNTSRNNRLIPNKESIFDRLRSRREVYVGTPVNLIADVRAEKTQGGLIVQVTGLPLRQGAFDVRLTNDTDYEPVNGVMTYTLKAVQPETTPQGADYLRKVYAGVYISNTDLSHINTIQILGIQNQRVLRP